MRIKKGDIVGRKSYGKDILFIVEKIIRGSQKESYAILKGLTIRIVADSPLSDLEVISQERVENNLRSLDNKLASRVKKCVCNKEKCYAILKSEQGKRSKEVIYTGKILHLDGDRKYSEKSQRYYKDLGLDAVVKNISENRQARYITSLLEKYNPDILVITGHDGMIKSGTGYNDIHNYRNSKHFIDTVIEARKWANGKKDLVIFAGACQSFFEAIMSAGANFASSPARVLIDFSDPLIVAEKIATTEDYKYVSIQDIAGELRDGTKGIGGSGARGKKTIYLQ
jgi:sporulation peptidase yabG